MKFYMPVRLYCGRNCLWEHAGELEGLGKRCLILTGHGSGVRSGALKDAVSALEKLGISYAVYDRVMSNPTVQSCREAACLLPGADFVWGIGGGSPLDAAKAAAVFCANPSLEEGDFYAKKWERALPIVLSGTTAGTGSEVTSVSVLTDSAGRKHSIHDDRLYARLAFGDWGYTASMPESVRLSTGVDVLMHCAESFLSQKADEITMSCAARGLRLVCDNLCNRPGEAELSAVYEASILGGLAINTTGTCFPHNVGYYLTERFSVPHGIACAAFLPELLAHCRQKAPERVKLMEEMSGVSAEQMRSAGALAVPAREIVLSSREIDDVLPRWENNGSVKNTLGNVTTDDIRSYLGKFVK